MGIRCVKISGNIFLKKIVYPEMQNYDFGEFTEQLDLAEEYYRERYQ